MTPWPFPRDVQSAFTLPFFAASPRVFAKHLSSFLKAEQPQTSPALIAGHIPPASLWDLQMLLEGGSVPWPGEQGPFLCVGYYCSSWGGLCSFFQRSNVVDLSWKSLV